MTFGPNTTDIKRSQLNAADGEVVFYDDDDDDNDNTLRFQTFQISLKIYCDEKVRNFCRIFMKYSQSRW